MKRIIAIFVMLFVILSLSGCVLEDICLLYGNRITENGFEIATNNVANCCYVGAYTCSQNEIDYEITIPDEYDGTPITRMGGYYGRSGFPVPFYIDISDQFMNAPDDSSYNIVYYGEVSNFNITVPHTVQELTFILNIGKNIKDIEIIENPYFPHINDDGSITLFHPVFYINCSAENKHFYSENGKLYDKNTNELISDFNYPTVMSV